MFKDGTAKKRKKGEGNLVNWDDVESGLKMKEALGFLKKK